MNVIKVKNLTTPSPSKDEMADLKASMAALVGPNDPLTVSLYAENWPGRQVVHRVYYVGLRTLTELTELDESKLGPVSWRFFAGGHKTSTTAAACMAICGGPGLPAKVLAVTRGTAPAEILRSAELLNELKEVSDNQNNQYELRVLRIPALGMEAFWLKSLSSVVGDLVVPYGSIPNAWSLTKPDAKGTPNEDQVCAATDFLKAAADLARQRLTKPDVGLQARSTRARKAPIDLARRPLKHLPRPGGSFSPKGVRVAGAPLERTAKAGH